MKQWTVIDDILDFAIGEEIAAAEFYTQLAQNARVPGMRQVFEGFAQEERGHKAKLESVKQGGALKPAGEKVTDLKLADYLIDIKPDPALDYKDALVVAMKKEKAAFKLYSDLAAAAPESLKPVLEALAQEEARHKLRFEIEYDNLLAEG